MHVKGLTSEEVCGNLAMLFDDIDDKLRFSKAILYSACVELKEGSYGRTDLTAIQLRFLVDLFLSASRMMSVDSSCTISVSFPVARG